MIDQCARYDMVWGIGIFRIQVRDIRSPSLIPLEGIKLIFAIFRFPPKIFIPSKGIKLDREQSRTRSAHVFSLSLSPTTQNQIITIIQNRFQHLAMVWKVSVAYWRAKLCINTGDFGVFWLPWSTKSRRAAATRDDDERRRVDCDPKSYPTRFLRRKNYFVPGKFWSLLKG